MTAVTGDGRSGALPHTGSALLGARIRHTGTARDHDRPDDHQQQGRHPIRNDGAGHGGTRFGGAPRNVVLNLIDSVVRNEGTLAATDRRPVTVVVGMQAISGVELEGMREGSEVFGGNLVVITQSLSKLDGLPMTMRNTVLANGGCFVVFQMSSLDANRRVGELGSHLLGPDDITSLPVHHAYSIKLRPPDSLSQLSVDSIRRRMLTYAIPTETARARIQDELAEKHSGLDTLLQSGREGAMNKRQAQNLVRRMRDQRGENGAGESRISRERRRARRRPR